MPIGDEELYIGGSGGGWKGTGKIGKRHSRVNSILKSGSGSSGASLRNRSKIDS
jgi:hypothetical protein